jgi:catechol 2,3-dioxygenase
MGCLLKTVKWIAICIVAEGVTLVVIGRCISLLGQPELHATTRHHKIARPRLSDFRSSFLYLLASKYIQPTMGAIHPDVRIGHVHLKVADLDRAIRFYRDVLGFELTQRYGNQAAFLSAGGYHHHIGLNTWESEGGSPPPPGSTGLYHLAIAYPTRAELADALRRVLRAGIRLEGASDHGVSEAIYLRDPDANGVELYWDRPREQWPHTANGELAMTTEPLDLNQLLREGA